MNVQTLIASAARSLQTIFPGGFVGQKHDHYADFSWPQDLDFAQLHRMYSRNGLASAAVDLTAEKTWEEFPTLWETEKPLESKLEADIRQRLDDLRFWQNFMEADKFSMVGGYSGLIMRFADSKRFDQPVDRVGGGLMGLVEIIPAWSQQLTVAEWDARQESPTYGHPLMYQFNEAAVTAHDNNTQIRNFRVHPDRVVIVSDNGTTNAKSALASGFNALIDIEKIVGAGGEGFWKNAKAAPVLTVDPTVQLQQMAQAMGVNVDDLPEAINDSVTRWQKSFDQQLFLQGIEAKTLNIALESPEHFFGTALQVYAASMRIPLKILVGNQTGERASSEDVKSWNATNRSRRNNRLKPVISETIRLLERVKILPERDWVIGWAELGQSSDLEKVELAMKMAEVNSKMPNEHIYSVEEIREVTGHEGAGPDMEGDDTDLEADNEDTTAPAPAPEDTQP